MADQRQIKTYVISREMRIKLLRAKDKEEKLRLFDVETREKYQHKMRMLEASLTNRASASDLQREVVTLQAEIAAVRAESAKRGIARELFRQEHEAERTALRNWVNNESNLVSDFPTCFVCKSKEEIDAVEFLRNGITTVVWPGDREFRIGLFRRSASCPPHANKPKLPPLHLAAHALNLNFQLTVLDNDDTKWFCCC